MIKYAETLDPGDKLCVGVDDYQFPASNEEWLAHLGLSIKWIKDKASRFGISVDIA